MAMVYTLPGHEQDRETAHSIRSRLGGVRHLRDRLGRGRRSDPAFKRRGALAVLRPEDYDAAHVEIGLRGNWVDSRVLDRETSASLEDLVGVEVRAGT